MYGDAQVTLAECAAAAKAAYAMLKEDADDDADLQESYFHDGAGANLNMTSLCNLLAFRHGAEGVGFYTKEVAELTWADIERSPYAAPSPP